MVSAVRVDGRRLHELAREGIEVERQPRPVTVYSFDVVATDEPSVLRIEVQCSAGTYIRTLADDLGRMLGGGAHLRDLRRTAVGSFVDGEARPPDECELIAPVDAMRDYSHVAVDDAVAEMVRHGRVLDRFDGDGPWAVVDAAGFPAGGVRAVRCSGQASGRRRLALRWRARSGDSVPLRAARHESRLVAMERRAHRAHHRCIRRCASRSSSDHRCCA